MVAIAATDEEAQRMAGASPFLGDGNMDSYIVGDPQAVAERIGAYVDIGVEHFILRFIDFPRLDSARLFAEEVIPEFTS